ncbi:MAG: complex I NDUFA9 subunit family protein [Pseudomonadota bacterium]
MAKQQITVIGGSGFIGRYVVQLLAKKGHRIRVGMRNPNQAMFLKPLGDVGQISLERVNVRVPESLAEVMRGADAAINLVGILAPSGKQTFDGVQAEGAENVAEAAKSAGVERFVQMSAIGADPNSPAAYGRTKAEGEAAVRARYPDATILRPSIVVGDEDEFFNRFASMARMAPALPLIAGDTKFQPVCVEDVAEAAVLALEGNVPNPGESPFFLGGPKVYTFEQLMRLMLDEIMISRPLLPIPMRIAKIMAFFMQYAPGKPLTPDQLKMLGEDNIVPEGARGFAELGIAPRVIETSIEDYLVRYRPKGRFSKRVA